ncbi:MAG: YkvA family protein [Pseudomonas sp.]
MKTPWNLLRFIPLAQRLLAGGRLPALLVAVAQKSKNKSGRLGAVKDDLRLLQALCLAWWRGEYRAISAKALLSVVAALLYFLSPIDAIPDWLLGIGYVDDIAVLAWLMNTWRTELELFRAWRNRQTPEHQAALEHLPALEVLQREHRAP